MNIYILASILSLNSRSSLALAKELHIESQSHGNGTAKNDQNIIASQPFQQLHQNRHLGRPQILPHHHLE